MSGWVYVISNEFIPGFVKVGKTQRTPKERIKDFERPCAAPGQYAVEYAVQVSDEEKLESHAHTTLSQMGTEYNKEMHKEWFSVSAPVAANTIKNLINELGGIIHTDTMGNILNPTYDEPFEYICYRCKIRLTESDVMPCADFLLKRDKRRKKIDSDICKTCFDQVYDD